MPQRGNFRALLPSPIMGAVHASEMAPPSDTPAPDRYIPDRLSADCLPWKPCQEPWNGRGAPCQMEGDAAAAFRGSKTPRSEGSQQQLPGTIISKMCSNCYSFCIAGVTCAYNVEQYAQWVQVNWPNFSKHIWILDFRFGATYVGASKIISMQVVPLRENYHDFFFTVLCILVVAGSLPNPHWRSGPLRKPAS